MFMSLPPRYRIVESDNLWVLEKYINRMDCWLTVDYYPLCSLEIRLIEHNDPIKFNQMVSDYFTEGTVKGDISSCPIKVKHPLDFPNQPVNNPLDIAQLFNG